MFRKLKIFLIGLLLISIQPLISAQKKMTVNGKTFEHTFRDKKQPNHGPQPTQNDKYRSIDGTNNNISSQQKRDWGSADIALERELPAQYDNSDRLNALNGSGRPSARLISNVVCDEPITIFTDRNLSAYLYVWGQFVDHDISLTPTGAAEYIPIKLPDDEQIFTVDIPFHRSEVVSGTGTGNRAREQYNFTTSWIDASNVYGSESTRAAWLRTFSDGKMKTSAKNLLPYNTVDGEYESAIDPNAPSMANDEDKTVKTFVAGDVRASEHPALLSTHTLFVREHNQICDRLIREGLRDDEEIYQMARKEVMALIQEITFNQFLPALGVNLRRYRGYDRNINPSLLNTFATAAYRLGHTMVADDIFLFDNDCEEVGPGELDLLDVFWNPQLIQDYGMEPFLKGITGHVQYQTDLKINNILRNFLFGSPTAEVRFGLDLAAINIQRGRDHGLPDYNSLRRYYTRREARRFSDITSDSEVAAKLQALYGDVNDIDAWVGLLAEDRIPGTSIGQTLQEMLKYQFEALRDGDYYYYENDPYLSRRVKDQVKRTQFKDVLERNTDLVDLQDDVFFAVLCQEIEGGALVPEVGLRSVVLAETSTELFPNPVANLLTINSEVPCENCKITVYTPGGQAVMVESVSLQKGNYTIDVGGLIDGLYILEISDSSQKRVMKFIKQE